MSDWYCSDEKLGNDGGREHMRRDQEALVVFNPHTGKQRGWSRLLEALAYLRQWGWRVHVRETVQRGDASALARDAVASGYSVVIAAGGDGTVNETIQGLACSNVILGILPLGVGNKCATEMGIPANLVAAAQVLTYGYVRSIDLGEVKGRYFLFGAGVGFDALVARHTSFTMKKALGMASYKVVTFLTALFHRGTETTIVAPDHLSHGPVLQVTIGNGRLYDARVMVTPEAKVDDGLLDVCIFKGQGRSRVFHHILSVLAHRHLFDPEVEYYRVPKLSVYCKKALLVQVDGEVFDSTPATFKVVPRCLKILVPRELPKR